MTDAPPKVLVCAYEIPQSINAGSMQLFRALQGYPGDRLLVLGWPPEDGAELLPCRYETLKLLIYRAVCTRFSHWVSGLNALNRVAEPQLSRSLKLAREFGPDLVLTVMDKLSYYKHAWALARALRVPLLTITMDDPQTFERAHPWLEGAFVGFLQRMYSDASLSLGVSQEMCEYLAAKFGKPSQVFSFGPPEGLQPRPADESLRLRSSPQLTLAYAGSMGLGYREGILAILKALESTSTRLLLYTKDQHALIEHPLVVNRGFLAPENLWPAVQAECDAVLLPYAFNGRMTRVYRTHFPTKLSEYCWTGMPMVLIGPENATGVRWGRRHPEAALTVTSCNAAAIGAVFERLRSDAALRAAMARAGAAVARAEFDPALIKRQFVSLLRQASTERGELAAGATA